MPFSKDELNITNFEDDLEKIETNEFKEETVSVEDLESNHNKKRYQICYVMFRKGIMTKSAQQQQAGNIYTTIESNKLKLTDLILIQQVQCLNLSRKPKRIIIIKNEATDFEKAEALNDDLDPNENYKQEDDDLPPPKKKCIKKSASLKKKGMLSYVSLNI